MTTIPFLINNVNLDEETTLSELDKILFNKDFTRLIHIPTCIKGNYRIPDTIETIGIEAFARCKGLVSVYIPSSVKVIGCLAFADCTMLKSIFIQSIDPILLSHDSDIFLNVDRNNCVLYVPFGSIEKYQQANEWRNFINVCEVDEFEDIQLHTYSFKTLNL